MGRHQMKQGPARGPGARKAGSLPPKLQARLAQAHKQRKDGDFAGAAETFMHMAAKANEAGKHGIAVHLAIQAARCLSANGDEAGATAHGATAVGYATPMQQRKKVATRFGKFVQRLRAKDHGTAADAIEADARERLGLGKLPEPGTGAVVNRAARRGLPKNCGVCAARVEPAKVLFDEDGSADCRSCGAVLSS